MNKLLTAVFENEPAADGEGRLGKLAQAWSLTKKSWAA